MKDLRSEFVRFLPVVLLGALIAVVLNIICQLHFHTFTGRQRPWSYEELTHVLTYGALWTAIGLASRQIKAAAFAFGAALLIATFNVYTQPINTSMALRCLLDIFCNEIFIPALVFLVICFKKQAWRYSWPLCLLALGFLLMNAGSEYLPSSPFNAWFHGMGIDELLKVNRTEHSHVEIDVFRHFAYLVEPGIVFLLIGECYIAATAHKKLQTGLKVTVPAYFTKTGAILQFITLRAAINLLAAGLLYHPAIWWLPRMSSDGFSFLVFTFLLEIAGSLALLVVIILYYRKLIVEYFKTYNWNKSWLYWLVNVPAIGILVFPLVVLAADPLEPKASTANI
jgi:hypothetical protein